MNRFINALGLLAVLAVVVVGCGGDDSTSGESSESSGAYGGKGGSGYGGAEPASGSESGGGAGIVSLGNAGDLGMVLVDAEGLTLYDFHKDEKSTSACYGACAEEWPPLLSEGEPVAEGGASAAKLGTTERNDGTTQVTYAGHPLYTFAGDKKPGEANGNDVEAFGAEWYALEASGEEPED